MKWFLSITSLLCLATGSLGSASTPITVQATLRGKKYEVTNVSTVRELQKSVEERSGLSASQQGVLFGGQKLKPSDILCDVGVKDGGEVNIVPRSGKSKKVSAASSSSSALACDADGGGAVEAADDGEDSGAADDGGNVMEELLKQAGIDSSKFDDIMKSMGGGLGGDGGGMPDMKQSMEMMQSMMNSPMFQQYFNDPERLEQSRQMIMDNPMMKSMMASLPGFEDILNDKVKWRETMMAAAKMYQDMGSMMDGAFGEGGDFGSFGGNPALDELSEGDD